MRASGFFCENLLEDLFVERQVRHQVFEATDLVLELPDPPYLGGPHPAEATLPEIERLLAHAIFRQTSVAGTPDSTCLSAYAICSSENRDFRIAASVVGAAASKSLNF